MTSTPPPSAPAPSPPAQAQDDHQSSSSSSSHYTIFDRRQKALIVTISSVAATFSGSASNIYFPAIPSIARDLDVSVQLVNLSVTAYLVLQGLAPSLWGPVSDVQGRRVAYFFTFLFFLGACVGLALTPNSAAALVVLRCLQSTGSASTIAIGSGVIGDITTRETRGGYMAGFQAGLLAPVAVGPIIGGALAGSLGWRSVFWFLTIYAGVFIVVLVFFLPETLRSVVGDGTRLPSNLFARYPLAWYQKTTSLKKEGIVVETESGGGHLSSLSSSSKKKRIDVLGPLRILFSKQAAPLVFFLATYYAVWQMSVTAMSTLFIEHYGLTETQVGLTFLANGVGSIVGTLITGRILDADYRRVKAKKHEQTDTSPQHDQNSINFPLEKARLRLVPVFSLIQCVSIAVFGWTIQFPLRIHIAVPIVTTFLTGWTAVSTQSIVTTYLVDVFPDRSAASSASLNLARCLFAAGATSFIMPMIGAIGVGWAFTVGTAAQVVAMTGLAVQWKFGRSWRMEQAKKEEEEEKPQPIATAA